MASVTFNFPAQQKSFSAKTKKWRKECVDFAEGGTFEGNNLIRKSVWHKKLNYDLINGIIHMEDLQKVINPLGVKSDYKVDKIQHYPIINSKLQVLIGEESKRPFDFKVVVTNPNAISEIEQDKKEEVFQRLQELVQSHSKSEEDFNKKVQALSDYYTFEWQDFREARANAILNHYSKEQNFPLLFNSGFKDGLIVGEEIYQCDIVGGEPVIERINPLKIRCFMSGFSNRIEDSDIIILEDYWSPGKIIDTYYDVLTTKDMQYIEDLPNAAKAATDSMGNVDERLGFKMIDDVIVTNNEHLDAAEIFQSPEAYCSLCPYDTEGNIRVLRVYWKSRRKIKKVKSYNELTGEVEYSFYPENYVIDEARGEEEEVFWINEAWEGTKIGTDIYVNMRPRVVQYNRLGNPSRCHFGIIGSIYNLNDSKPFSMVDMMKQFNYLYDAVHDRLNKLLSRNFGKLIEVDFAKIPKGWDMDKWMYYAKMHGFVIKDSFREGNVGASTGKLAGALNNATSGVIDAELGQSIQSQVYLLEFIKNEMAEVCGISKQREGQISNRETVGGVERANLQSSHITEWLFLIHDDVKRRAIECFLETAKIAMKGRNKKFQYILPNFSQAIMEIDGDEFADCDYGIVVDNSNGVQELNQKLDALATAALQNQALNFSSIMKLYNSSSVAEKQRMIEKFEQDNQQRAEEQAQQQQQLAQQQLEQKAQELNQKYQLEDQLNQRDNETKILVAEINAQATAQGNPQEAAKDEREFIERVQRLGQKAQLDREKFEFEKEKFANENAFKERESQRNAANKAAEIKTKQNNKK